MSYLSLRLFSPELYAAATSEPAVVANRKMKDAMEKSDCDPAEVCAGLRTCRGTTCSPTDSWHRHCSTLCHVETCEPWKIS
eukprot:m.96257 g.96257  ORF g.96257 m.96257 type:complete len:81 (+) comp12356_c0_seq6:780-1022(+)